MEKIKELFKDKWYEMVVGALGMNLLSTAFAVFVNNNPLVLLVSFATIVVLILLAAVVRKQLIRPLPSIFEGRALGHPRKGIVLTIGLHSHKKGSPALKVLERQKPKYCALIGTEKTFMENVGQQIALHAGIKAQFFKQENINPIKMAEIKAVTISLIHWMMEDGLHTRDIVVDITGGTVPMSLAAYTAASELGVDTQYVYSDYDKDRNIALNGTQKAILNPSKAQEKHYQALSTAAKDSNA